jgi:hypothetical protein
MLLGNVLTLFDAGLQEKQLLVLCYYECGFRRADIDCYS